MKTKIILLLLGSLLPALVVLPEVVDEIYAIVNDEVITLYDLRLFEQASLRELESRLSGEELAKAKEELKKNVMNLLINQKVVKSKLKEKNYNVENEFQNWIKNIKKENNIPTDEDLKRALQAEGIDFDQFKEQQKKIIEIQYLKYDEIGAKLKIDNSQIMEYFRKNIEQFTIPEEYTVNAIYLKKVSTAIQDKAMLDKISAEVKADNFAALAKAHSQLPEAAATPLLGKFKKGELAKELQSQVEKMKVGEISTWIETANGWYMLQLSEYSESKLKEFKDVREEITNIIRNQIENERFSDYIEKLKKESYIKILKPYPGN